MEREKDKSIVKYKNNLNSLNFKHLTAREMDLLMAICTEIKDRGTDKVRISFKDFHDLLGYRWKDYSELHEQIKTFHKKVGSQVMERWTDTASYLFFIFHRFKIDHKGQYVEVSVSEDFAYLFNSLVGQYTSFRLLDFARLRSRYAKALYRLIKQWDKTRTHFTLTTDDFRTLFDIPKTYNWMHIDQRVLRPALSQCEAVVGKGVKVQKHKTGRLITSLSFFFPMDATYQSKKREIEQHKRQGDFYQERAYQKEKVGDYDSAQDYTDLAMREKSKAGEKGASLRWGEKSESE
jgi:plasmid replication initiation protein